MYLKALKSEQKEIFLKLKKFSEFYLVGGTALALQIGHRISVDFDLFSSKEIPKNLLPKIKKVFKDFKVRPLVNHSEQLSVVINKTKVDFVRYKFPLFSNLIEFEGVKIVSISDIAAMKAFVLNYRGTLKDYIDLYFILKNKHSSLRKIKELAEKKYKDEFNFRLFLEQLIYLKEIREEEIVFLTKKTDKKEMQDFFERKIKKLEIK